MYWYVLCLGSGVVSGLLRFYGWLGACLLVAVNCLCLIVCLVFYCWLFVSYCLL